MLGAASHQHPRLLSLVLLLVLVLLPLLKLLLLLPPQLALLLLLQLQACWGCMAFQKGLPLKTRTRLPP